MDKKELRDNFWKDRQFEQEVANKIFGEIEKYREFLHNVNGTYGLHYNDIDFNAGVRGKKNCIHGLNNKRIRNSRSSKEVMGYTKIPSTTLFGDRLGGLEIFFLAPGEETGYLVAGEEEKKFKEFEDPKNPVERTHYLEILFPLGSWIKGENGREFYGENALRQITEDKEELFHGGIKLGLREDEFREKTVETKNPEFYITRGFLPGGQRFGEKSTIINPSNVDAFQMFGLMGINTNDSKNRNLMAMVSDLGKNTFTDRSYHHIKGSNKKL